MRDQEEMERISRGRRGGKGEREEELGKRQREI